MNRIIIPTGMRLRKVQPTDHEWLVELHNDAEVLKNLNDTPITLESHMDWWNRVSNDKHERRFIFEVNGERVGFTKIYSIDHRNERCLLGADIHPLHRGKGLAKFMWTLMLEFCFDMLKLHRAGLRTAEYNTIGQRVYNGIGFIEEGRLKEAILYDEKRWDDICMRILKPEWDART